MPADSVDRLSLNPREQAPRPTGRTPMEMILRSRIAVAKQLLAETTEPIAKVARQSGFNSPTQFCVAFRKQVGITPSAYRDQMAA